jgi:hypothetical protein
LAKVTEALIVTGGLDQLRSACGLMNLSFIFDEDSDREKASEVHRLVGIILDALHHPKKSRPDK